MVEQKAGDDQKAADEQKTGDEQTTRPWQKENARADQEEGNQVAKLALAR